jgi:hypothetical protein
MVENGTPIGAPQEQINFSHDAKGVAVPDCGRDILPLSE